MVTFGLMRTWLCCIIFILNFQHSLFAQCDIEDYEIFYCSNQSDLDLTLFEPNSNGSYTYFENGIEIIDPINFEVSDETNLIVLFSEFGSNCTAEFEILISYNLPPTVSVTYVPVINCFINVDYIIIEVDTTIEYDFEWNGPNGFYSKSQNPLIQYPGEYNYIIDDIVTGCQSMGSVLVENEYDFPMAELDTILNCDGTAYLSASPLNPVDEYQYYWFGENIISAPDSNTILIDSVGLYVVEVADWITGCIVIDTIEIENIDCSPSSDLELAIDNSINTYPNPFTDLINIETDNPYGTLEIIDQNGRLVFKVDHFQKQINLSHLPEGIYFLSSTHDYLKQRTAIIKSR